MLFGFMQKTLKIVHVSSEIAPFSKTGGLADVARSLPKAQKRLGHEVIVITPLYERVIEKEKHNLKLIKENVEVYLNSKESIVVNYWLGYLMDGLPAYFIENKKYFSKHKKIYGSSHENARFLVFDVAALKLISLLKFEADIIHCHDWQTGLIPFYLKTDFRYSKTLKKVKTVFTIHNLIFQLGHNWWEIPPDKKDYGRKRIPHISDPDIEYVNFAKRAILKADAISTVSEQHREEIMTKKYGQDLNRILKNREDRLFGIVNGIDYKDFNPGLDPGLFKNFDYRNVSLKAQNKIGLQKMMQLPADEKIPLIGMVARLAEQKGFDLLFNIFYGIMTMDVQFVIFGDGKDKKYVKIIKDFIKKYPQKINAYLELDKFNVDNVTKVYAGSDMFLIPSRFEPCGITQLIAMRYGSIPIVRHIGGLIDTVRNYNPRTQKGNGFVFKNYDPYEMLIEVARAVENYKYSVTWNKLVKKVMQESNTWEIPAKKYILLYQRILKMNGNRPKKEGNHKILIKKN